MKQLFIASLMSTVLMIGCQSATSTAPGKGGSGKQTASAVSAAELSKIGLAFQGYESFNGKGPSQVADLQPFLKDMEVEKGAYQKLAQGDVVFFWNAATKAMKNGASNTVLAYEKTAPTSGGLVLMGSGEVKTMTADEFAGKPKADQK